MRRREFAGALAGTVFGLYAGPALSTEASDIAQILRAGTPATRRVLALAQALQLQMCWSIRDSHGQLQSRYFRADSSWFAPASLIKLPLAAMVLEELEHKALDWRSGSLRFPAMPDCAADAAALRRPQSVQRLIERALVISDDSAYCALFDFLGPQRIAQRCAEMGYVGTRIQARFGYCGAELSRVTGPVWWHQDGALTQIAPERPAFELKRAAFKIELGQAWMRGAQRIEGPKDFSDSNTMRLRDLHQVLLALSDPSLVPMAQRFKLSASARQFLLDAMARNPAQSRYVQAEERRLSATAFRLLAVGDGRWPASLQVRNKVGWAFGFLSDMAHLRDTQHECWLSCVMYLNADGVLNDGRYDYDSIGRPFMAEAGRLLLAASPGYFGGKGLGAN